LALRGKSEEANPLFRALLPSLALFCISAGSSLIVYSEYFFSAFQRYAGLFFILCSGSILLYTFFKYSDSLPHRFVRLFIFSLICATAFLFTVHRVRGYSEKQDIAHWGDELRAQVLSSDESRYSRRIILSCASLRNPESPAVRAITFLPKRHEVFSGDILIISAKLEQITADSFLFPMSREGIHYTIRLYDNFVKESIPAKPLRERIRDGIIGRNISLYGERNGGVINALWLGDGFFVDKYTSYTFTRAGLLHILAASGSHVAIVAGIPFFLLAWIGIGRKIIFSAVSVLLAGYLYITCAPVSLVRACVMFWIFAFMFMFGKERQALNALFLSGAVILLLYPYDIYSLGFQLSFCATAGLILFYEFYKKALPHIPFKVSESLSLSCSAQLFVFPVIALTLGQVNLTGIAANLVLVPGMSLAMTVSAIPHVADLIHPGAGNVLGSLVSWFIGMNLKFAEYFASLNGHFLFGDVPVWCAGLYAVFCLPPVLWFRNNLAVLICTVIPLAAVLFLFQSLSAAQISKDVPFDVPGHSIHFEGTRAVIKGGINPEESQSAHDAIARYGYCHPEIYLTDVSEPSLAGTLSFVKQNYVAKIVINRKVPLNNKLRGLLETAEIDGVLVVF
jgi:ComEC/Rec2-related protein